jgi:hypothetical protein
MEKELNSIEIGVEIIPIYTLYGLRDIIKLSDFVYGEWLVFESNKPLYYINIFDEDFIELKNSIESKETTIENFIRKINTLNNKSLSLRQNYFGFMNYKKSIYQKIRVYKFPFYSRNEK